MYPKPRMPRSAKLRRRTLSGSPIAMPKTTSDGAAREQLHAARTGPGSGTRHPAREDGAGRPRRRRSASAPAWPGAAGAAEEGRTRSRSPAKPEGQAARAACAGRRRPLAQSRSVIQTGMVASTSAAMPGGTVSAQARRPWHAQEQQRADRHAGRHCPGLRHARPREACPCVEDRAGDQGADAPSSGRAASLPPRSGWRGSSSPRGNRWPRKRRGASSSQAQAQDRSLHCHEVAGGRRLRRVSPTCAGTRASGSRGCWRGPARAGSSFCSVPGRLSSRPQRAPTRRLWLRPRPPWPEPCGPPPRPSRDGNACTSSQSRNGRGRCGRVLLRRSR